MRTEYYPEWVELLEMTRTNEIGTIVTFKEIEDITRLKKTDAKWPSVIQRWRKHLLEEEYKCLINIRNVGYEIIHPRDHHKVSAKFINKSNRQAKNAIKVQACTDVSHMTDSERTKHQEMTNFAGGILAITAQTVKKARKLVGKTFAWVERGLRTLIG